jgi:mRNA-degrading endonuclease YafQ of YafQ-DinJ toxin-antitoxin module
VSYQLVTTSRFERRLRKFVHDHPDLKPRLARVLRNLEADPFQPHLRPHPPRDELQGLHAVSVTYSYRLTLILRIDAREITLLDIGSHDEVY